MLNSAVARIVAALVTAAIIWCIGWGTKRWRDRRDSARIYNFLVTSKSEGKVRFRSTHAIAKHTKLPADRVAKLCAHHPKIRRNEKEKELWRLDE